MDDPDVRRRRPGGINGFDYFWLAIAVAFDLFAWFGGYGNRGRIQRSG